MSSRRIPTRKPAELRAFRKKVTTLKKQGLISKTIDARSAFPTSKSNGKSLQSLVKKYDKVASGKQVAVKVPPGKLKAFRETGYKTAAGRVLYDKDEAEQISYKRGGISRKFANGVEKIHIPVKFHNLEQYFADIVAKKDQIDNLKAQDEVFAFRFYGNNSHDLFGSIAQAVRSLVKYNDIVKTVEDSDEDHGKDIYRHLEIVRLNHRKTPWLSNRGKRTPRQAARAAEYAKERRKKNKNKHPKTMEFLRALDAARAKAYRARVRNNKKRYAKYRKDSLKRALKSQADLKNSIRRQNMAVRKQIGRVKKQISDLKKQEKALNAKKVTRKTVKRKKK